MSDNSNYTAYLEEFKKHPILHLVEEQGDRKVSEISFGQSKAYSLVDVLGVITYFVTEGSLPEESKGVTEGRYKGHSILTIPHDSKYPFSFGRRKAELIVQFAAEIVQFAETGEIETDDAPAD